ncbi:MAG: hypothetical protein FJ297_02830 [Planctomycetes bacterium]|nr:hypothetical protein [Planctomycetota bacterium]
MKRRLSPNKKHGEWLAARGAPPVSRLRADHVVMGKRRRGADCGRSGPSQPPEDWYDPPEGVLDAYRIIEQYPGDGLRHVLTADEIRDRLARLPGHLLANLDIVQLSRMTRKKCIYPCYGMQWGTTIYLYPIEESLTEYFNRPPRPSELREAAMYGAVWSHDSPDTWVLQWTWPAIRDYYLNNVLIHELGHIVDDRNRSHVDRERYADWFAIEYGYKASRAEMVRKALRRVIRRHDRI